ncbi:MAG: hypothetical protein ACRD2F_02985 [Terriglobales bacterium]
MGHRSRLGAQLLWAALPLIVVAAMSAALPAQTAQTADSSPEAWLVAHLRLAGPPSGASGRFQVDQTWTPARGGSDPVDLARVTFFDSVELEVPITRHGRPLSRRRARAATRHLRRMQARVRVAWRGPRDDGRLVVVDNRVMRIDALIQRFDWRALGMGSYLGQACRRFAFAPRPGMVIAGRAKRVMAAMGGQICVDPDSGLLLEVQFHNQEPVKFGLGVLGDFHAIRGSFALQRAGGAWTWGRTVIHLRGRELWFDKSGTMVKQYLPPSAYSAATRSQ